MSRDDISLDSILSKFDNQGYERIRITNTTYQDYIAGWDKIVSDIEDPNKSIQDILFESGRFPLYKIKGVWVEQKNRMLLDNDGINFFIIYYAQEGLDGRRPSTSPDFASKNNNSYEIDTLLTQFLLELYNKSYIFSMSQGDKILRCLLYSVASGSNTDERYALSIRVQPKRLPSLKEINVPLEVKDTLRLNTGLNLISGFAGNGKTWTLSALINHLNLNLTSAKVIGTIEEPIEFLYKNINAYIVQREVLKNTPSFKEASSDALRQGFDIVVFGELRGKEEMYNALMLAESGKQVFATIHSNSVVDTIERFVSEFDSDKQQNIRERLLENLTMILHQELIRYDGEQYPVVDMIQIKNGTERMQFKEVAKSRNNLAKTIKDGSGTWITNSKLAYKELVKRGVIRDTPDAQRAFRAD